MSSEWLTLTISNSSVEQKMSWAKARTTTRKEDQAYCLLGLLDIFISPIYGEGEHAWTRLMQQLEYKNSVQPQVPGRRTSKKTHKWFRLKGVKKEIGGKGRFTSQTIVTAEASGYSQTARSMPDYPIQSYSVPMSMSALPPSTQSDSTPPKAPMSVPPQSSSALSTYTPRPPMSAPPPGSYSSRGYEEAYLQYSTNPLDLDSVSRQPRKAIAMPKEPLPTLSIGAAAIQDESDEEIEEGKSSQRPALVLKHRYGSAWSFHDVDGYRSVWYHELAAHPLSTYNALTADKQFEMARKVRARASFRPSTPGGLAFDKDDIIILVESFHKDWWKRMLRGRTGIFPQTCVEDFEERLQMRKCSAVEPQISTLPSGEEPGLEDWIRLDAATPGAVTEVHSHRGLEHAENVVYEEPESSSVPMIDTDDEAGEDVAQTAEASKSTFKDIGAHDFMVLATDSPENWFKGKDERVQNEPPDPQAPIPELNDEQLSSLSGSVRHAFANYRQRNQVETQLSALMYPSSSPGGVPLGPREQIAGPIGFIESDNSIREDDENSIQSEHFETAPWGEARQVAQPQSNHSSEQPSENWSESTKHLEIGVEEKEAVFVRSTVLEDSVDAGMVTIRSVVLRALLDPSATRPPETSNETSDLAATAVEYIRSLLLSRGAAQMSASPRQQQTTTTTVEAYRLQTSQFHHTAVAETRSTTMTEALWGEGLGMARRQDSRDSWYLHGVWADSV